MAFKKPGMIGETARKAALDESRDGPGPNNPDTYDPEPQSPNA